MKNINLKELNNSLTTNKIIELVTELGCKDYIDKENYIIFKTICHHENSDDGSMKLYYYKKDHRFVCYTECGCSFNIFTLFQKRYELLNKPYNFYKDIVLKIAAGVQINSNKVDNFYEIYQSQYDKYKIDKFEINYQIYNENILNSFIFFPIPEWIEDGISENAMRQYNIKYSISQNKVIIPHYDGNSNLIGIRGRALNLEDMEDGKYMPLFFEGKTYAHPLSYNLYGLNFVKNNIKKFKMAIISEGEKGVLQYSTMFGQDNNICVASCGSSLHKKQIELLVNAGAEKILIAYDKEGESQYQAEKYFNKLRNFCNRYKNICKMGFIYDTKNLLSLKDSPFDKGKEIFIKLYREAYWL